MAGNLEGPERQLPPGIGLIGKIRDTNWTLDTYKTIVFGITFIAYASYHASRKPISIVKSQMEAFMSGHKDKFACNRSGKFNGKDGALNMGFLDLIFLSAYAGGTYFFGWLGDKWDLRLLLAGGMVASGITVGLLGVGYFLNIRDLSFYLIVQLVAGFVQASGWPCVGAVISNWLERNGRGWKMGVWNAHSPVGNIIGSILAACLSRYGWGWSFLALGANVALAGLLVFLFLTPNPRELGFNSFTGAEERVEAASSDMQGQREEDIPTKVEERDIVQQQVGVAGNIGFIEAWRIPAVVPYALSLFFMKLVSCTFMYWLPFYLSQEVIGGEVMSVEKAGNFSILFDVGGLIGGILAGYISDRYGVPAITAAGFMLCAIPSILVFHFFGRVSQLVNFAFMVIAGFFVSGPNTLITTAVSADLGTHGSIRRNARALATVTAIVDGTGSIGAAFGPLLIGLILPTGGWNVAFWMLATCALISTHVLSRQVLDEVSEIIRQRLGDPEHRRQLLGNPR